MRPRLFAPILVIFLFLAGYLFFDFVRDLGGYGPSDDRADAIVVLTGGMGRVEEGLRLLRQGAAPLLILSGVNRDADLDSIFLNMDLKDKERRAILLEKGSASTIENAKEMKRLALGMGLKSLILITSVYHMKRAMYIFRSIMPRDVEVSAHPVSTPNFDELRWWSSPALRITLLEFIKYYWFMAAYHLGLTGA